MTLRGEQRAWIQHRDEMCFEARIEAKSNGTIAGGSPMELAVIGCKTHMTDERAPTCRKGVDRMFNIYASDSEDRWRYLLGISGSRPLLTVGLYPSTATRERADPTVARVKRVTELHGFDGFVMMNLCAVRATDYRKLPIKTDVKAYTRNIDRIEDMVAQHSDPTIWAPWGEPVVHHVYFLRARDELYRRLAPYRSRCVHFGELTATGHPRHASRLNYAWQLQKFDIS